MATVYDRHEYPSAAVTRGKPVSFEAAAEIGDRLFKSHTKSWSGTAGEQATAEDKISNKRADPSATTERLFSTQTKSRLATPEMSPSAQDIISRKKVQNGELDGIIERLHTTHTTSSSGGGDPPKICTNSVAREVISVEEVKEIYKRLSKTHTKSSSGVAEVPTMEPLKPPGYGLKMLPAIEGLDTRFAGHDVPPEKVDEVIGRLLTTQTSASQARVDNPRILLYPERTTLMNNVERIKAYQETGAVAKQPALQRREKWYN